MFFIINISNTITQLYITVFNTIILIIMVKVPMFIERLKDLRKKMGISQKTLVETLQISQQLVVGWETGRSTPNLLMLIKISKLFGVSVDYLVGETDIKKPVGSTLSEAEKSLVSEIEEISAEGLEEILKFAQLVKLKVKTDKRNDAEFLSGHEGSS